MRSKVFAKKSATILRLMSYLKYFVWWPCRFKDNVNPTQNLGCFSAINVFTFFVFVGSGTISHNLMFGVLKMAAVISALLMWQFFEQG